MERIDLDAVIREPDQGYTSKGDQPKWQWKGKWYKADYMGYEALSEVLISRLLKRSNVSGFAEYGPVWIRYQGGNFLDVSATTFGIRTKYWCRLSGCIVPIWGGDWRRRLAK